MRDKRNVAVVLGSYGEEHEASVAAGMEVVKHIQGGGTFDCIAVEVSELSSLINVELEIFWLLVMRMRM